MREIVFATNNPNKLKEIKQKLAGKILIRSLSDINCQEELPETHETLIENAIEKAQYVSMHYGVDCFADDTGMMVEALNGDPGVYSAMYSGSRDANANMDKVLSKLGANLNRNACFKTIIALVEAGEVKTFEGRVDGVITQVKTGEEGFGYDPIFQPNGFDITFAQMSSSQKNEISHRAKAVDELVKYLA